ncbi:hypothetical protein LDENG_00050870 [Lucifuga dentata]|nr:hypothetical protein LDENG_00050870 [Lucifuga dentata]
MWSMKVILLLCCYACLSTSHERIYFKSRNFYNVLHWDPIQHDLSGEQVLYTVQYWSDITDHQPFQTKMECQNITALFCDLTAETPSVSDIHYKAQVFANGHNHGRTNTFKPIAQTILGRPSVLTETTVSALHVKVKLPLGPNNISIADIFNSTKSWLSKPLTYYILNITHPKWAAQVNTSTTGQFDVTLKNNNTKYCGYVVYKPGFEWGRPPSEKTSFCFKLQDGPWRILPWLLITAVLLLVIVIIVGVCKCCYAETEAKSMPQSLQKGMFNILPPVLQSPDENLFISTLEFCPETEQTVYSMIQVKPKVSPGGYSPQDAQPGSFDSSMGTSIHSSTRCQETSTQSSENYVAVHIPDEENEDFQQDANEVSEGIHLPWSSALGKPSHDEDEPVLNLRDAPPLPGGASAGLLLLHTVRDTNGQLKMPTLIFQLQGSICDPVSSPDQEGKPLLSDLINSRKGSPSLSSLHSTIEDSEWLPDHDN